MCGNSTRQSQGGALVVLSPSRRISGGPMAPGSAGRLIFHDKDHGSLMATHATFAMEPASNTAATDATKYMVGIHATGDLTTSAIISPFIYKFNLEKEPSNEDMDEPDTLETRLDRPLAVAVGGEGIIGRRVTLWEQHATEPFAEGIVGYN